MVFEVKPMHPESPLPVRLLTAFVLIVPIVQPALAQGYNDAAFGFHHSLDPLDGTGERFRLSVRDCRTLGDALNMLREKHGWLITDEVPTIVNPGDFARVTDATMNRQYPCPRVTTLDVDYRTDDPFDAVSAIVAAYNATSPPYTASVAWCGIFVCVRPASRLGTGGQPEAAAALLDTRVSLPTGPKTFGAILQSVEEQLDQVTAEQIVLGGRDAPMPWWTEVVTSEEITNMSARDALQLVVSALTQRASAKAHARAHADEQELTLDAELLRAQRQLAAEGMRQGLSDEAIRSAWLVKRAQIEQDLTQTETPTTVDLTPGVGPGWVWRTIVTYTTQGDARFEVLLQEVADPSLLSWSEPLKYSVPLPGVDSDQDGVADQVDWCPGTADLALVAADGCSVQQTCPCDAPWANNGAYGACVRDAVNVLVAFGLVSHNDKGQYQSSVKEAGCGQ